MDLLLFGIQGSGKGTQAKKLAAEFGFDIFEAGGELRKIAASTSELGGLVRSYIDAGKLVPFDIIMKVVAEAILLRPAHKRILFDGIPRDLDQQREFDSIMAGARREFRVVHLTLDPEEGVQRIFGRAKTEGRKDDSDEAVIRRRMATFMEKTLPVLNDYKSRGLVTEIDGSRGVEEVYGEIREVVVGHS